MELSCQEKEKEESSTVPGAAAHVGLGGSANSDAGRGGVWLEDLLTEGSDVVTFCFVAMSRVLFVW